MTLLLSVLAGWAVLRGLGADHVWPWRLADLVDGSASSSGGAQRARGRAQRARGRARSTRRRGGPRTAALRRQRVAELERDVPVTVDLLHLAVTAGHSLHTAVTAVGRAGTGPAARALADAVELHERGARLVDALEGLPARHGPALRPLTTTLCVAASSGSPLGPALQRLADAERRRLRRRTEERVRRLPVLLLGPLVGLILPAFVLLAIVPVALTTAGAGLEPLDDLRLPATGRTGGATTSLPLQVDPTRSPP